MTSQKQNKESNDLLYSLMFEIFTQVKCNLMLIVYKTNIPFITMLQEI